MPKSTGKPQPIYTPNNRPLSRTQANCRKYCGVLTSAFSHLPKANSSHSGRDAHDRVPPCIEALWFSFPTSVGDCNRKNWPDNKEREQLHCVCQPEVVWIHVQRIQEPALNERYQTFMYIISSAPVLGAKRHVVMNVMGISRSLSCCESQ